MLWDGKNYAYNAAGRRAVNAGKYIEGRGGREGKKLARDISILETNFNPSPSLSQKYEGDTRCKERRVTNFPLELA